MAETEFYAQTAMHDGCGRKKGKGEDAAASSAAEVVVVVRRKKERERYGGGWSTPIVGAVALDFLRRSYHLMRVIMTFFNTCLHRSSCAASGSLLLFIDRHEIDTP
jgi:hypothetical protein